MINTRWMTECTHVMKCCAAAADGAAISCRTCWPSRLPGQLYLGVISSGRCEWET